MFKKISTKKCIEIAIYFLENKSTVRKTAKHFGYSKSSIHNYLHNKLTNIDHNLFTKVKLLLDKNNAEKHLRGGIATKNKFKNKKVDQSPL